MIENCEQKCLTLKFLITLIYENLTDFEIIFVNQGKFSYRELEKVPFGLVPLHLRKA